MKFTSIYMVNFSVFLDVVVPVLKICSSVNNIKEIHTPQPRKSKAGYTSFIEILSKCIAFK